MAIPQRNNVYGVFECNGRIAELTELVRNHMALADDEIWLKKSQFDNEETLIVCSNQADFATCRGPTNGELLFNGAVAGSSQEVRRFVQDMHRAATAAGFRPRFEIYDKDINCLAQLNVEP
jgi:hypothetical protein